MPDNLFKKIVYGGDYNPDQWIETPEVWDEDIRLMKLAHINCMTVNIFSWSLLEPEEGKYNFGWLDTILDKLYANGIDVILATPSGARPPWLAQKYPEVLRVNSDGRKNEFGVRHNHCPTSPIYREKVHEINTILAERYKNHPAVKMWHISNEYSGDCHCELCQNEFRKWLKNKYGTIENLNRSWWNGFWSHLYTSFSQINSPKNHGENHISAMKLDWKRFTSDNTISFYENEIEPLRRITPDIPVTTNFMRMDDGINLQDFAKHVDIVAWDNYPTYSTPDIYPESVEISFCHDFYRSLKGGKPFFMMESTPSIPNWKPVNKLPWPGVPELTSVQAVAHGADSVQYFQWRKSRGGHEKYHGACVDHVGHENTRVFREVTHIGETLDKLTEALGTTTESRVAVIAECEVSWASKVYCGYNNNVRNYVKQCVKWYRPFSERGIPVDVISLSDDFSKYDLILAPYLYLIREDTEEKIANYVNGGGSFLFTAMSACVDRNDMAFRGGLPAGELKNVFGVWAEETDSFFEGQPGKVEYDGAEYNIISVCDIIHAGTAKILGNYASEFYSGLEAITENKYGKGTAWYVAFDCEYDFANKFADYIIKKLDIKPDTGISFEYGVSERRRGDFYYLLNFNRDEKSVTLDGEYEDVLSGEKLCGSFTLPMYGYRILKKSPCNA